jgi:hypothetical protein
MKSNAQLRHEGQVEVPQPHRIQVDLSAAASSSQNVPPSFNIEATFAQLMSTMGSLQREVSLIEEHVEQSQIDIRECLKYNHPKPNNDEDLFVLMLLLFKNNLSLWDFVYFYTNGFSLILCLPLVLLRQKRGVFFIFGPGIYFQTGQVIFVSEWPKREFVSILYWQHSGWQKHFM